MQHKLCRSLRKASESIHTMSHIRVYFKRMMFVQSPPPPYFNCCLPDKIDWALARLITSPLPSSRHFKLKGLTAWGLWPYTRWFPTLSNQGILGLKLPGAFIASFVGQGFWELQSKNTWVTQGWEPLLYTKHIVPYWIRAPHRPDLSYFAASFPL